MRPARACAPGAESGRCGGAATDPGLAPRCGGRSWVERGPGAAGKGLAAEANSCCLGALAGRPGGAAVRRRFSSWNKFLCAGGRGMHRRAYIVHSRTLPVLAALQLR